MAINKTKLARLEKKIQDGLNLNLELIHSRGLKAHTESALRSSYKNLLDAQKDLNAVNDHIKCTNHVNGNSKDSV